MMRVLRNRVTMWLVVFMLILATAACGAPTEEGEPDVAPTTGGTGEEGPQGKIVVAQGGDAMTLDPQMHADSVTGNVLANVFDTLVIRDEEMQLQPHLATEWKSVDDQTWEFSLRESVKFHNGDPLTAEDVKFSLERVIDPENGSPQISDLEAIERIEVVDELTVRIITKAPFPTLLGELAGKQIMSKALVEAEGPEFVAEHPVGTGPFKFVEWAKDEHIVLEANEDYWLGAPHVKTVEFRVIPENQSRIAALQTGQVDIIVNVPPDQAQVLNKTEGVSVSKAPSSRVIYIGVNTLQDGPLADPRVRQALNYAVNKQGIIDSILLGNGARLSGPVTEAHFGHNPSLEPYKYDPDRARELLAEAGYADGFTLNFDAPSGRYLQDKEIAQAVAGQLQEVGIEVDLNVLEWGVFIEKVLAFKLEGIWLLGWGNATFDADGTLFPQFHSESRHSYYHNSDFDSLVTEARSIMDQGKREKLYNDAIQILHEDAAWIFMHQQMDIYGVSDRVQWKPRSDELIWLFDASVGTE